MANGCPVGTNIVPPTLSRPFTRGQQRDADCAQFLAACERVKNDLVARLFLCMCVRNLIQTVYSLQLEIVVIKTAPYSTAFVITTNLLQDSLTSTQHKTMIPNLKSCYVLLNRNFLKVGVTSNKINKSSLLEIRNSEGFSNENRNPSGERYPAIINKKNNYKLREKGKINYSDDIKDTEDEDSCSEFSYDSSSSDDEEMTKERKGRKKHDSSNTSPKKLGCLFCPDKSFKSHWSYLKHKRSHECNPYKCKLCFMKFPTRQSFFVHMKRHHPEVEPFLCEYSRCEQNFKTQRLLEIHHKMHWKFMCKYCKKLFLRKHHMQKHVLKMH